MTAAALVSSAVLALAAQERGVPALRDAKDFAASMVRIDDDWLILSEAIDGPTYLLNSVRGDGLTRLNRITGELSRAKVFFTTRAKTDAVDAVDRALLAVDGLRAELARAEPDQAAALEEVQFVTQACSACHERFRDGDATSGYRFKPGVID